MNRGKSYTRSRVSANRLDQHSRVALADKSQRCLFVKAVHHDEDSFIGDYSFDSIKGFFEERAIARDPQKLFGHSLAARGPEPRPRSSRHHYRKHRLFSGKQFSVFSFQFSVFSFQFSVFAASKRVEKCRAAMMLSRIARLRLSVY
jgi:hypothetical protein